MTDTKRWTRKGSTIQRLAGTRLMDVDRIDGLDTRLLAALKSGKLELARDLMRRRRVLGERIDEPAIRQAIEKLANGIDEAIASGLTEEQILAYHRGRAQQQSD